MSTNSNRGLRGAFEAGFSNAAVSFSQLVNDRIFFNSFHHGLYLLDKPELDNYEYQTFNEQNRILLTTEVFGDLSGKSYLFLSQTDVDLITRQIPASSNSEINLKDEFLKEVDNILSAAVITKLANALNLKIFGDVPVLAGSVRASIEDLIADDFGEQDEEAYVNSMYFSFEKHPALRPLFVWVFDTAILKLRAGQDLIHKL